MQSFPDFLIYYDNLVGQIVFEIDSYIDILNWAQWHINLEIPVLIRSPEVKQH